jgi:hypothetical protein
MKARHFQRVLKRALLVGAPLALAGCIFDGESSCPDDGYDPPRTSTQPVDPSFANGGALDAAQCQAVCDDLSKLLTCVREDADSVLCIHEQLPCEGRRPAGLRCAERVTCSGFARYLADAAWLEAASIDAFRALRRELRAHGAPRRLLRSASRGARDEARHARRMRAVARRHGVAVAQVERDAPPPRPLVELALENAVEGCVRETWGALVARHQAARAQDRAVREAMVRIAPDEARHAQLAWEIDAWLAPRLAPEERRRVSEARASALAELDREVQAELAHRERASLGLPDAAESRRLLKALFDALPCR